MSATLKKQPMSSYWPETESIDLPHLNAQGIRLRVGMVAGQSRWSSTSVNGSMGGSMYNGNGYVGGSISSSVTNHHRVFVEFPEDSSEVSLDWDDWDFDVRDGQVLILACGPADDRACLAYNAHTRQTGPKNSLKIGEHAATYAQTYAFDLWFWRLISFGIVVGSGVLGFVALREMIPVAPPWSGLVVGICGCVGGWLAIAGPLAHGAGRVYRRRLGRKLRKALLPEMERAASRVPRLAHPSVAGPGAVREPALT